jgi:putative redox protein
MAKPEKFTFAGASGHALAARLDTPAGPVRGHALFAHCFTCSKDVFAAARVSGALAELGFAVLRFDFTGLGHSGGEFANTDFTSNIADLVAAADFLRAEHEAPKLLIGHSLGGAAVLAAAAKIPEAVAVVTIGAPFDPAHISGNFGAEIDEIENNGEAEVTLGGRPFTITKAFLDDINSQDQEAAIAGLGKALLVCHAPLDDVVGIENAAAIFGAAKHPKSFLSLDDADHLLSKRADAAYVAGVVAAWAMRYAGAPQAPDGPGAREGEVVVEETGESKFAQAISVGGCYALRADEPASAGGTETGPTPYDFLLAGLGACTAMTMRLYAERKGLALERARVTLTHEKIHAEDCADCETKSGKIDAISRVIHLEGDLGDDDRAGLLRIADKCPVHRTLRSEIRIETTLAE